jgi:hypothetical protein
VPETLGRAPAVAGARRGPGCGAAAAVRRAARSACPQSNGAPSGDRVLHAVNREGALCGKEGPCCEPAAHCSAPVAAVIQQDMLRTHAACQLTQSTPGPLLRPTPQQVAGARLEGAFFLKARPEHYVPSVNVMVRRRWQRQRTRGWQQRRSWGRGGVDAWGSGSGPWARVGRLGRQQALLESARAVPCTLAARGARHARPTPASPPSPPPHPGPSPPPRSCTVPQVTSCGLKPT